MKTLLPYFKKTTSLLILMLFMAFAQKSFGQTASETWALTSNNTAGAPTGNITASTASSGSGVTASNNTTYGLNAVGWSTSNTPGTSDYFQYSISPTTGNGLTVSAMSLIQTTNTTGTVKYMVNYYVTSSALPSDATFFSTSTNIYNGTVTSGTNGNTIPINSLAINVPTGSTIYVRVYAFNVVNGSSTIFGNKSFIISGTTTPNASITTGTITGSPFCVTASSGASVSIPFTSSGTFSSNTYTAQLSSSTGSFTSPTNIGTLSSNLNTGTISGTIPAATATGTGYLIRVISSNPSVTGSSSSAITVNHAANSVAPTATQNINASVNGTALTVTEQSTPTSRQWYYGTVSGGPYGNVISGATGTSYSPNFSAQGAYYVVCVSTFACGTMTTSAVQINVAATVTTGTISGSPYCVTASTGASISVPFTSAGTFTGNTYTAQLSSSTGSFATPTTLGTLVSNANSGTISGTIPAATATGTGYLIRVISSSPSITGSSSSAISINYAANSVAPTSGQNINTSTSGTTLTVTEQSTPASRQWYYGTVSGGPYGNAISGATSTSYAPNFASAGTYYVVCKSVFACATIISNEVQIVVVLPTITTGTISGSPFCVTASSGAAVSVPFTSTGNYSGNTYTAQLSSSTGSFASPTSLGTLVSNANSGTISGTIPAATTTGAGYLIRVISNSPSVTGTNSSAIAINYDANSIAPTGNQTYAAGANGTALSVTEQSTVSSRQWYYGTVSGTYNNVISGATGTSYTPNFTVSGTYYVVCKSTFACAIATSNAVQVIVNPGALANLTMSTVASPEPVDSNFTSSVTITGKDAYGNLVNGGNVNITTTAGSITPASVTLSSSGTVIVSNFKVTQSGSNQTITATSAANSAIFVVSNTFTVNGFNSSATGDYFRSSASGDWATIGTWQGSHDGTNWYTPSAYPTSTATSITILNTHNITITSSVTGEAITVNSGGIININSGGKLSVANGSGTDLTISGTVNINSGGTLANSGAISSTTSTLLVNSGGTYQHSQDDGTIPSATWNIASTCYITGTTGNAPSGLTPSGGFGNFTWECAGQQPSYFLGADVGMNLGNITLTVNGDFSLKSTNTSFIYVQTLNVKGAYKQSGGSFNTFGSTSTINIAGNFVMSGGTMEAQSYNFFGNNPATLNVNFNGTTTQSFQKSAGIGSIVTNNGLGSTATNNFTINNGAIVDFGTSVLDGATTFTLSSGATLITANQYGLTTSGTGSTGGSVIVSGARTYSSGASYNYDGITPQNTGVFTTTSTASTIANLTINNAAGVTLSQPLNVTGVLFLNNGILTTTATNLIKLTSTGSVTMTDPTYTTTSYVNGPLQRTGTGSFTFPVGKLGVGYVPIGVAPTTSQTFTGEYFRASALSVGTTFVAGTNLKRVSSCDYWRLDLGTAYPSSTNSTLSSGTANVTVYWNPNNSCDVITDLSTLAIGHYSFTNGWDVIGTGTYQPATGTTTNGSLTYVGAQTFSPFALGSLSSTANPLPITLDYFTATKQVGYNKLTWKVECTSSSSSFDVERSYDGINFAAINTVKVSSATDCALPFVYDDYSSNGNKVYYRIKMVDIDDNAKYSNIELISNDANAIELMNIQPNPVYGDASLKVSASGVQNVELAIIGIDGKQMQHKTIQVQQGTNNVQLNTGALAKGIYFVKGIFANGQTNVIKFVKQ